MDSRASFVSRFRWLQLLRASLVLGALYDFGFAVLMVAAPWVATRVFGLPLPGEVFYLWIMAVFLTMLAALYLAAARDPRRYSAVILVAIVGRAAGAGAFTLAALGRPELTGLYPLAAADAFFALAHLVTWRPTR